MNIKHKIFILLLVGVLGFLVFRGWNFLKTKYLPAAANIEIKEYRALLDSDLDDDGLSDIEESFYGTDFQNPDSDGDGYLDGEEVASGYNPRLPAPKDVKPGAINKKASSDINLTERLRGRLYASIYEGELSLESIEGADEILDDIAYRMTLESLPIFYAEDVEESELIILYEYTDQEMQEYSDNLFRIINDMLIRSVGQIARLEEIAEFGGDYTFRDEARFYLDQIESILNRLYALPAPKPLVPQHIELINIVLDSEAAYKAMETSDGDSLKALATIQRIIDLNEEFQEVFTNLILATEEHELEIPDLSLINLLKHYLDL